MSSVNVLAREVAAKIVFYGPGLSGKTTTLRKIHESIRPTNRGEMMSLATEGDRTLFFDFLPVKVERVGDCAVRLALYTVPGQVFYNATRKLVLQGADGVVFVADSQAAALEKNREALANLEENLADQGIRFDRFPLVFQWNKRDVPGCLSSADLHEALNSRNAPEFETCATDGRGILDALKSITRLVIRDLREKRVVPALKPATLAKAPAAAVLDDDSLEHELQGHLNDTLSTLMETPAAALSRPVGLGPLGTLAPIELLDPARAADAAFAAGDYEACIRACVDGAVRALTSAGDHPMPAQAYLLRVDGGDLLRLQGLASRSTGVGPEDAAFAIYVTLQIFVRLRGSALPTQ